MLIMGICGGFDPLYEERYQLGRDFVHDGASVLVEDGEVVAGIEEERINRIKHSNKSFFLSLRHCLAARGAKLDDVDAFAYYATEPFLTQSLRALDLYRPEIGTHPDARGLLAAMFAREFGRAPAPERLTFVDHHLAHAMSAYAASGFEDALVLTVDGAGEQVSTTVGEVRDGKFHVLRVKPVVDSLGFFYLEVIRFLGYTIFDEYKVMGLAPYGDAGRYRAVVSTFYALLPDGEYRIFKERVLALLDVLPPRRRGEPFRQEHMDLAAALQAALEEIVLHVLGHFARATGQARLAIAGGVGQNSTMNGTILRSGLFRDVFVAPAAADSGCALGAALAVARERDPARPRRRLAHVYWGTDVEAPDVLEPMLARWSDLLRYRRLDDAPAEAARLIAGGAVLGWVQGRSEFGPRSLGNRSIVADPRVAGHKETINAMIKKREGYRPFAPSVLAERVRDFFEVPTAEERFPFMSFVLPVREEWRARLGAITHVDGSARLQTVSRDVNPRFWSLIAAFERLTGVPILLNTSFNNNVEPIVDTVEDAVVCYLTSGLHYLVAGDFLVEKHALEPERIRDLRVSLPVAAELVRSYRSAGYDRRVDAWAVRWNYDATREQALSPAAFDLLRSSDGRATLRELIERQAPAPAERRAILEEMLALWHDRWVVLRPATGPRKAGSSPP